MDENEEYEYGQPIPPEYRNRLFDWIGGGYDGCFMEYNQGLVDKDGHWHPIHSTGRGGIDQAEWYERKISALKADLGYDCIPADVQHHQAEMGAIEEVFGEDWYEKDVDYESDPRFKEIMAKEDERYRQYCEQRDGYRLELTHRLDCMFMEALKREFEDERPTEIGLLDDEHIKETCGRFCESYSDDVGVMTYCLDKMAEMGYDVWCTCSDCGEQFQCWNYENFRMSVDDNDYTGDGGIGVIMKRVLCDSCHDEAQCRECGDLSRPNARKKTGDDWDMYDFLACVLLDWMDVCWGCSSGFDMDELQRWDETVSRRVATELGKRYYDLEERISEGQGGLKGHALYEKLLKTRSGRKTINEVRDLLSDAVMKHFHASDAIERDWRYDVEDPGQMRLPVFEKKTEQRS